MSTKVITGKCRASYAKIMRPGKNEMTGKEEYSVQVLVPKSDTETLDKLKAAAKAAIAAKWPTPPKGLRNPLRDGDTETKADGSPLGPEYHGHFYFNTKCAADRKPNVVDMNGNDLFEADAIVSGDYIRVSVNAYAYDAAGNRGVAFGLNNVLFVERGEPLGQMRQSAAEEFGIVKGGGSRPEPAVAATADDDWA